MLQRQSYLPMNMPTLDLSILIVKDKSSESGKVEKARSLNIQILTEEEFIELYNPHPYSINVTDYTIIAGTTKTDISAASAGATGTYNAKSQLVKRLLNICINIANI